MGQNAALRRDAELLTDLVEKVEQHVDPLRTVGRRIDSDGRIAGAEKQAIDNAGGDPPRIVGRMIGLEANREPAGQADRIAKSRHDVAFRRYRHQVLQAADLGDGGGHFRADAWRQRRQNRRRRLVRQQPIAKAAHRQMGDRPEGGRIVSVDDQARHLVVFVWDHKVFEERAQGQIGERILRRHPRLLGRRRKSSQLIPASRRRGLSHQRCEIVEDIALTAQNCRIHGARPLKQGAGIMRSRRSRRHALAHSARRNARKGCVASPLNCDTCPS